MKNKFAGSASLRTAVVAAAILLASVPTHAVEADLIQAHAIVDRGVAAYSQLQGYQAILQRDLRRKDGTMKTEKMFIRRDEPNTVFLKYITGRSATLQVLFSEGKFGGKIMTRPPGLFFDFIPIQAMDPADPRVTGKEKRPIQDAGIGHMIRQFSKDLAEAEAAGKARVLSVAPAPGMSGVTRLEVALDLPGQAYPRTAMYFQADGLPIGVDMLPATGEPAETYHYSEIQPNPAKDDAVFLKYIDRRILVDYYRKI